MWHWSSGLLIGLVTFQTPPDAASTKGQPPARPSDAPASRPAPPTGAAPSLFPEGYLDHAALSQALRQVVAESGGKAQLSSLARTREGRDVWLVRVAMPETEPARPAAGIPPAPDSRKSAILIVANLEADHLVGSQVTLKILERIRRDPSWEKRLEHCDLYVVPRLNPDGAERLLHPPRKDLRTNLEPVDRDRDGSSGEDGPDDLNGDGLVTQMRVKDAKATLIPDPADPRSLRKADPAKGERPIYSEYLEGIDNDGDGLINEDPPGGVNLNRNWPYRWTEFDPESGFSPVAEPETRALIQFAFDHPEIAVIWTFSLNDNLRVAPKKPEATYDGADLPIFAELARLYGKALKEIAKAPPSSGSERPQAPTTEAAKPAEARGGAQPKAASNGPPAGSASPSPETSGSTGAAQSSAPPPAAVTAPAIPGATTDGALSEWAYHQFGVLGLSSRLWEGPELAPTSETKVAAEARPGGPPAPRRAGIPEDGQARWLYWNDQVMKGSAFVPFAPFDHPTLGKVEIGGWKPGVRLNPPIERVGVLAHAHEVFLGDLASRLPRLTIRDVKVEPKGRAIYEVKAAVVNEGQFPTALVQGTRSRKAPPVRVRLDVGAGRLLAGPPRSQFDALGGSGGRREFRWLVLAPDADDAGAKPYAVTLSASTPKAGAAVQTIPIDVAR